MGDFALLLRLAFFQISRSIVLIATKPYFRARLPARFTRSKYWIDVSPKSGPAVLGGSEAHRDRKAAAALIGGRRQCVARTEPALQENLEPGPRRIVIDRAVVEMRVPRLCPRHRQAFMPGRGPAVHHRVRDFGMKLQCEGGAEAEGLHFENIALREELRAVRHVKALAVPLIDAFRPGLDDSEPCGRRPYWPLG
jgi:hypothetical protein